MPQHQQQQPTIVAPVAAANSESSTGAITGNGSRHVPPNGGDKAESARQPLAIRTDDDSHHSRDEKDAPSPVAVGGTIHIPRSVSPVEFVAYPGGLAAANPEIVASPPINAPKGVDGQDPCTLTPSSSAKRDIAELYGDAEAAEDLRPGATAKQPQAAIVPESNRVAAKVTTRVVAAATTAANVAKQRAALLRAKVNLKKAMVDNMKALAEKRTAELARRKGKEVMRPINALLKGGLDTLLISGICNSGPAERVRFDTTVLLEDSNDDDDSIDEGSVAKPIAKSLASSAAAGGVNGEGKVLTLNESIAQAKRRLKMKQLLSEAKEKKQQLEEDVKQRQQASKPYESRAQEVNSEEQISQFGLQYAASTTSSQFSDAEDDDLTVVAVHPKMPAAVTLADNPKPTATRAELMIRKKEAERQRALSHAKHMLSKQKRLRAEQALEAQTTQANLDEWSTELAGANAALAAASRGIRAQATRQAVLDEMLAEKVSELVRKRKQRLDCRTQQSRPQGDDA